MNPDELGEAIKNFRKRATSVARDTGNVSVSELVSILHDTITELKESKNAAFMAIARTMSSTGPSPSLSNLRAVDIFNDSGVWATLDE